MMKQPSLAPPHGFGSALARLRCRPRHTVASAAALQHKVVWVPIGGRACSRRSRWRLGQQRHHAGGGEARGRGRSGWRGDGTAALAPASAAAVLQSGAVAARGCGKRCECSWAARKRRSVLDWAVWGGGRKSKLAQFFWKGWMTTLFGRPFPKKSHVDTEPQSACDS